MYKVIHLSPIETLLAKPERERTAIEQAIVFAYRNGEPKAEEAASEYIRVFDDSPIVQLVAQA